jgi:hypothetical protein
MEELKKSIEERNNKATEAQNELIIYIKQIPKNNTKFSNNDVILSINNIKTFYGDRLKRGLNIDDFKNKYPKLLDWLIHNNKVIVLVNKLRPSPYNKSNNSINKIIARGEDHGFNIENILSRLNPSSWRLLGGNIYESPQINAALREKVRAEQELNKVKLQRGKLPNNILNSMIQSAETKLKNAETKYKSLTEQPQQAQQSQEQSYNNMNEEEILEEIEYLEGEMKTIPQKNTRDFTKIKKNISQKKLNAEITLSRDQQQLQNLRLRNNGRPKKQYNDTITQLENNLRTITAKEKTENDNLKKRREIQIKINKLNKILDRKFPVPVTVPVTAPVTPQVTPQVTAPVTPQVTPQVTPKKGFFSWFTGGNYHKTHKSYTNKQHHYKQRPNKRNKTKRNRK